MKKELRRLYRIKREMRKLQREIGRETFAKDPYLWNAACRIIDGCRVAIVRLGGSNDVGE